MVGSCGAATSWQVTGVMVAVVNGGDHGLHRVWAIGNWANIVGLVSWGNEVVVVGSGFDVSGTLDGAGLS